MLDCGVKALNSELTVSVVLAPKHICYMPTFLRAMSLCVVGLEHRGAWSEGRSCARQRELHACGGCSLLRASGWSMLVWTVCG